MKRIARYLLASLVLVLSSCTFSFATSSASLEDSLTTSSEDISSIDESISSDITTSDDPSSSEPSSSEEGITPYDIYLLAVEAGFNGTYESWLNVVGGTPGRLIELSVDATHIYWRYIGAEEWIVLIDIASLVGSKGITGDAGLDGLTPYIGSDGNWWLGDQNLGIPTAGAQGESGSVPYIGDNGNWWILDTDTGVSASGAIGKSAFEVYLQLHPDYMGSEQDWIGELISGNFASEYVTVTFDSNGGSPIDTQTIKLGLVAQRPVDPTKPGHTFIDWYMGDERWVFFGFAVTEDITLTAEYEPIVHEISYELDGGFNHPDNIISYIPGSSFTFKQATRLGYDFDGWYLDLGYSQPISELAPTDVGNITLYAKWVAQSGFTITYDLDGGVNAIDNLTFVTNQTTTFNLGAATKSGYLFDGWYQEAEYITPITSIVPSSLSTNMTVYAKFTIINATEPFSEYELFDKTIDYHSWRDDSSSKITSIVKFQPEQSGFYLLFSTGGTNPEIHVYDTNGNLIAYDNDSAYLYNFYLRLYLDSEQSYYVETNLNSPSSSGLWRLYIRYQGIEFLNNSIPMNLDTDYSIYHYSTSNHEFYYRYRPKVSGYYRYESAGSMDTAAILYNSRGEIITTDDNSGLDDNYQITMYLTAGYDYYYLVYPLDINEMGTFTVRLTLI